MRAEVSAVIESLIKRKFFTTEEEAIREMLKKYILGQIAVLQREMGRFERKYGMHFERFGAYLHERSLLLAGGSLSAEQRQVLGRAIVQEEDDLLDWKVTKEMLESWLGLRQEIVV
jgi:hypothetical protein